MVSYAACCGRWHDGELRLLAPTAEALMRSRYAAFVLNDEPYLLATWHAGTRPASLVFEIKQKWLGLEVVDTTVTSTTTAEVEFIARYRVGGGSAGRHHERSRFVLEQDRWFYVDGTSPAKA